MDAVQLAERLGAAGLDPAAVPAKARLFDIVIERCRELVGGPPVAVWWVPGRLEVFGTHTDYAGGRSLVAALPRGFVVAVLPRTDGVVRATDALGGEHAIIEPLRNTGRFRGWRHYLEVVAGRLARNFPGAALGADVIFASDLPRAAGTSSSSALVVGAATALVQVAGLRTRTEWRSGIRSTLDEAGYLACIENGRAFGPLVGDGGVGTHGGSEDHAAIVTATPGACSAFGFVPMRHLDTVAVPVQWTFVVASSGVRADKSGSVRAAYNRLSDGADALLQLWNANEPVCSSLGQVLGSSEGALARLRGLVGTSHIPGWTVMTLRDRLDHFAREDARVVRALDAFRNADTGALADLAEASQRDAEERLRNQVPETTMLVRCAMAAGAVASRSFGAGFGGSAWAVLAESEEERVESFVDRWMSAYRGTSEAAARGVAFVSRPGPPLTGVFP